MAMNSYQAVLSRPFARLMELETIPPLFTFSAIYSADPEAIVPCPSCQPSNTCRQIVML